VIFIKNIRIFFFFLLISFILLYYVKSIENFNLSFFFFHFQVWIVSKVSPDSIPETLQPFVPKEPQPQYYPYPPPAPPGPAPASPDTSAATGGGGASSDASSSGGLASPSTR